MTCATLEPDLVDLARGAIPDDDRRAAIDRHLRDCSRCAARLESERAMSAGLRRLAEDSEAPPLDPERERTLLAAFDGAWDRPRAREWSRPAAAAALLALAATLAWMIGRLILRQAQDERQVKVPTTTSGEQKVAHVPSPLVLSPSKDELGAGVSPVISVKPRRVPTRRPPAAATTDFVVWPGAADLPTFESGHLMRMALPASMAVSLGLRPSSNATVVQTDVLVGQDGYARALRLVP